MVESQTYDIAQLLSVQALTLAALMNREPRPTHFFARNYAPRQQDYVVRRSLSSIKDFVLGANHDA